MYISSVIVWGFFFPSQDNLMLPAHLLPWASPGGKGITCTFALLMAVSICALLQIRGKSPALITATAKPQKGTEEEAFLLILTQPISSDVSQRNLFFLFPQNLEMGKLVHWSPPDVYSSDKAGWGQTKADTSVWSDSGLAPLLPSASEKTSLKAHRKSLLMKR